MVVGTTIEIVDCLLGDPELLAQALDLSEQRTFDGVLKPDSDILYPLMQAVPRRVSLRLRCYDVRLVRSLARLARLVQRVRGIVFINHD